MATNDLHGIEALRQAAELVVADTLGNTFIKIAGTDALGKEPVLITGAATPSGLTTAGLITEMTIASGSWTDLPATPLVNRNAITIQNPSAIAIKVNFAEPAGFTGIEIAAGGERFYNITDNIIIKAKSASGTPTLNIEEVS